MFDHRPVAPLLCSALLLLSCSQDGEFRQQQEEGQKYFAAAISGEGLQQVGKVAIDSDGKSVWEEGDRISVWNGTSSSEFTLASGAGENQAVFTGYIDDAERYTVFYPSSAALWNEGKVIFSLPTTQVSRPGSLPSGLDFLAADTQNRTLCFAHIASALKFVIGPDSPALTSLEISGDMPLSGTCEYDFETGKMAFVSDTSNRISYLSADGEAFAEGVYYISMPAAKVSSGTMTLTFTFKGGHQRTFTVGGERTFQASHCYSLGTLDFGPVDPRAFKAVSSVEAGLDVVWAEGDRISLFCSVLDNADVTLSDGALTSNGIFEGNASVDLCDYDDYVALYPYQENASWEDGILHFEFPGVQNEYFKGLRVAKAEYSPHTLFPLAFRNLYTNVRVPVSGDGQKVTAIEITGNNGELLSGSCSVSDFSEGAYSAMNLEGGCKSVRLQLENPVEVSAQPVYFDIAIPAVVYYKGISVKVFTEDESECIEKSIDDFGIIGTTGLVDSEVSRSSSVELPKMQFEMHGLMWSPGYLTMDEKGYRFTDSAPVGGKETCGLYFKHNSTYGIYVYPDLVVNGASYSASAAEVWHDKGDGSFEKLTMSYTSIPADDGTDPCSRVPVASGEPKWHMPTWEEFQVWARPKAAGTCISSNQTLATSDPRWMYNSTTHPNKTIYAVYDGVTSEIVIFKSNILNESGAIAKKTNWCYMWYAGVSNSVIGVAPNNASAETLDATPQYAAQIRCCRTK